MILLFLVGALVILALYFLIKPAGWPERAGRAKRAGRPGDSRQNSMIRDDLITRHDVKPAGLGDIEAAEELAGDLPPRVEETLARARPKGGLTGGRELGGSARQRELNGSARARRLDWALARAARRRDRREHQRLQDPVPFPTQYGLDQITLMVKDPHWIYTYWELTGQKLAALRRERGQKFIEEARRTLRIYDLTSGAKPGQAMGRFWDIPVRDHDDHWYIMVGVPDRRYMVEIGAMTPSGEFIALACSNEVTTPRNWPVGVEYGVAAYYRFGGQGGLSSPELVRRN